MGYNPEAQTMSDRPEHLAGAVCSWPADPVSIYVYEPIHLKTFQKVVFKCHWFGLSLEDAIHLRFELDNAIKKARAEERNTLRTLLKEDTDETTSSGE